VEFQELLEVFQMDCIVPLRTAFTCFENFLKLLKFHHLFEENKRISHHSAIFQGILAVTQLRLGEKKSKHHLCSSCKVWIKKKMLTIELFYIEKNRLFRYACTLTAGCYQKVPSSCFVSKYLPGIES
jgi:hypothetical protein